MLYEEIKEFFMDRGVDTCASDYFFMYDIKKRVSEYMESIDNALENNDMRTARRVKEHLVRVVITIQTAVSINITHEEWIEFRNNHHYNKQWNNNI